ncbi:hypothetical protein FQR65_LT20075 [Abscondita terminalis]|nr:hypothetical protein FQR65_LT20075 [Abscondita terminalis]
MAESFPRDLGLAQSVIAVVCLAAYVECRFHKIQRTDIQCTHTVCSDLRNMPAANVDLPVDSAPSMQYVRNRANHYCSSCSRNDFSASHRQATTASNGKDRKQQCGGVRLRSPPPVRPDNDECCHSGLRSRAIFDYMNADGAVSGSVEGMGEKFKNVKPKSK